MTPGRPVRSIGVVVVTHNSAGHVERLLDSIPRAAEGLTTTVVVVDNASSDTTVELLKSRSDIDIVESGGNLGYSGGINRARRHLTQVDALAIVNPDLTLGPGCLTHLAECLSDPTVGVAVPVLLDDSGHRFDSLRRELTPARALGEATFGAHWRARPSALADTLRADGDYARPHDVDWASGALWLVSAACDAAVGPWDERFFLYSEETDYARRVRAAGFRVRFAPAALAWHVGGGSGSSAALTALMSINQIRDFGGHHGRVATALVRAAVGWRHLLRCWRAEDRYVLRIVVRRSRWATLPRGERPDD